VAVAGGGEVGGGGTAVGAAVGVAQAASTSDALINTDSRGNNRLRMVLSFLKNKVELLTMVAKS
jgi:hypothetical protein